MIGIGVSLFSAMASPLQAEANQPENPMPMKTFVRSAILLGALLCSTATFAQVQVASATKEKTPTPEEFEANVKTMVLSADYMIQELGVSEEQGEKLKSIEADINQQLGTVSKLDPEVRDPKEAEIYAQRAKMVESVLTPEQMKKMDEVKRALLRESYGMKDAPPAGTK